MEDFSKKRLIKIHNILLISLIFSFIFQKIGNFMVSISAIFLIIYILVLIMIFIIKLFTIPKEYYRFGCIVAIIYCLLVFTNLVKWSWFWFIMIYISGMFFYNKIQMMQSEVPYWNKVEQVKFESLEQSNVEEKTIVENKNILDKDEIMQRIKSRRKIIPKQKQETIQIEKNALFLLIDLKAQCMSELSFSQNKILNDIHDVFAGLQQKINQIHERKLKREIEDILKASLNQLQESIDQYIQYPKNLRYYPSEQYPPSPQEYLVQKLQLMLEQLIEVAEILYREDLESIMLHSQYLQQQLKPNHFFKVGKNMES